MPTLSSIEKASTIQIFNVWQIKKRKRFILTGVPSKTDKNWPCVYFIRFWGSFCQWHFNFSESRLLDIVCFGSLTSAPQKNWASRDFAKSLESLTNGPWKQNETCVIRLSTILLGYKTRMNHTKNEVYSVTAINPTISFHNATSWKPMEQPVLESLVATVHFHLFNNGTGSGSPAHPWTDLDSTRISRNGAKSADRQVIRSSNTKSAILPQNNCIVPLYDHIKVPKYNSKCSK